MKDCLKIDAHMESIRARLMCELDTPENFSGCLRGCVNDYLDSFSVQLEKLKAMFEKNRDFWRSQIQSADNFANLSASQMNQFGKEIQVKLHSMLRVPKLPEQPQAIKVPQEIQAPAHVVQAVELA
mmetsp:Transcript_6276/g.8395  ORF Transcript_6276/g.8395 Transcript_6276/m.8395 type:complete len:126 (-) Transcript_6276:572-949(-)